MAATIQLNGAQATIEDGEWKSGDKDIERLLAAHKLNLEYNGYEPDPDLAAAEAAVKAFGGKLIHSDEVEGEEGVVY